MENSAKKYAIPIISLFLLMLATVAYGESDDQPKWDATMFGAWAFGEQIYFGTGGAVGYSFTHRLELEGEGFIVFIDPIVYGVSGALLCNFELLQDRLYPYILGGMSVLGQRGDAWPFYMWGGGIKCAVMENLGIRIDLRFYMYETEPFMRMAIGFMWTFK